MLVDNETGMILNSSSPIQDPIDRMSGLILESELGMPPTSPILPAARTNGNVNGTFELPLTPSKPSGHRRTWASYNKKTHIFTVYGPSATSITPTIILASSPPPQPVVKNAFSLLGKKKVEPPKKPAVKEPKEFQSDSDMDMAEFKSTKSRSRKAAPKKTQKKEVALPPPPPPPPPPAPPPEVVMMDPVPAPINPMFNIDPQLLGWKPLPSINPPPAALTSAAPPPEKPAPAPAVKKAPHPFFSASGRKKLASTAEPAVVETTMNAGPTAAPTVAPQAPPRPPSNNNWALSFSNTKADAPKIPGMKEPAWPVQGSMHVRGLSPLEALIRPMNDFTLRPRKSKDTAVSIPPSENILHRLASRLQFSAIEKDVDSEDYATRKYFSVPSEVRLPIQHIITSSELQDKIRARVNARLPHPKALKRVENPESDSDSNGDIVVAGTSVHPALFRLYKRLGTEFTAFDFHRCETVPWEVKYAPQMIGEILQPGNEEKKLIRNWLIELQTDNVIVKAGGKGKRKAKGAGKAVPKKKRKKKNDDLDGFVVDGESESNIMDDITDVDEDDWLVNPTTKTKKSTVRSGDKANELQEYLGITKTPAKKTNTIVISGPTGCGKTAAVYAVAKELGFHVFEVFSGMKRSGKDIQEQVGDMSRNHLVHQRNVVMESNNPFAKAKAAKSAVKSFEEELQMRQKQSLILFEEVDVLFEEDKGFWSAVISLMAESKRPIVLTCNDESQIPWDDLQLHAILRFSLPPSDILVDYLLLMAANEGHLLNRKAIYSLMLYNGNDIRACIMNLQFYCCMAVGDRRAGLDWMIDRSSAGKDIGANGEKLRVVSEDTYHWGMGLAPNAPSLEEDEKWRDVWDEHHLDIGASAASEKGLEDYASLLWERGADKITSLDAFCNYYDSLSAADAFSSLEASGSDLVSFPVPLW
jgi:nucleoside-triphosphatase THEP1